MAGGQEHAARLTAGFVLPRDVRQAMADHAVRDRPNECCGLLVGRDRTVVAAVPMRNVAASPTRFRIDDRDHIALRRAVRLISPPVHVIGVYHSHPGGVPRPSPTDVAEAHYPEWLYLIVGFVGGRMRIRGFRLDAAGVRPVRLVTDLRPPAATTAATRGDSSTPVRTG